MIYNRSLIYMLLLYFSLAMMLLYISSGNDGIFIYTLDDPYIHLAVAENILHGNYGVNLSEMSAPSSSILWPYLIVFLYQLFLHQIPLENIPLIINIFSGALAIIGVYSFIYKLFIQHSALLSWLAFIFLIVATNLYGLVFMGMEHVLQITVIIWIAYLFLFHRNSSYLYLLISLAPTIRYENLAISIPLLIFLFLNADRKKAVFSAILLFIPIIAFSLFLYFHNLGILPTSIMIKAGGYSSSISQLLLNRVFGNLSGSFTFSILFFLAIYSFFIHKKDKTIAILLLSSMFLHIIFGRTGWFHRYEMYIVIYSFMLLLFLYKHEIINIFNTKKDKVIYSTVFIAAIIFINIEILASQIMIPIASKNIKQQQYVMSLVAKNLNRSVAVNDLGLVSFQNNNYVLDLYGLASKEAIDARLNNDTEKMMQLAKNHQVCLVMIYDNWFTSLPGTWKKIAVLHSNGLLVSPIQHQVSFYTTGIYEDEVIRTLTIASKIYSQDLEVLKEQ